MCGICGLLSLDGETPPDRAVLEAMNAALTHRGPDSAGLVVRGAGGLAARRLSIIDLEGGDQPIGNEDDTVHVAQNGEIYNFQELRDRLERAGHVFRTRCDTEVLVHLYEEEGDGFAQALRGMFAVSVWDARRRRLVLARDRFGIKPLYWRADDGVLAFASELKSLVLSPGFSRDLDPHALESFLAFNSIPAPLTMFAAARTLPPGHLLTWEPGREPDVRAYAAVRPVDADDVHREPEEELARELDRRLRDSVRAHLIADVPVGVLLSGGVDSGTLCALAAQESGTRISTFSVGFEERSFDELERARAVAERYGTDHHEVVVRPDAAELLIRLSEVFDEPLGDSSALPTYLVAELAAGHVKVALSGEGGDELFGGYHTYVADLLAARIGRPARLMAPLVGRLPSSSRRVSLDYMAKRFVRAAHLPPLEAHHGWKEIFSDEARAGLLRPAADVPDAASAASPGQTPGVSPGAASDAFDPLGAYRERWEHTARAEPLARLQDLDLGVYLPSDLLVKTDRASMAHSLEARVPFLDPVVAELAMALPTKAKVRGWSKKRLLKRAAAPLLPAETIRGRKRGFSIPAAAWLRGELAPFAREVLSPAHLREQDVLRPEAVTRVLDRHVAGTEDLSRQIWGLLTFTLWYDRWGRAAR